MNAKNTTVFGNDSKMHGPVKSMTSMNKPASLNSTQNIPLPKKPAAETPII